MNVYSPVTIGRMTVYCISSSSMFVDSELSISQTFLYRWKTASKSIELCLLENGPANKNTMYICVYTINSQHAISTHNVILIPSVAKFIDSRVDHARQTLTGSTCYLSEQEVRDEIR